MVIVEYVVAGHSSIKVLLEQPSQLRTDLV